MTATKRARVPPSPLLVLVTAGGEEVYAVTFHRETQLLLGVQKVVTDAAGAERLLPLWPQAPKVRKTVEVQKAIRAARAKLKKLPKKRPRT